MRKLKTPKQRLHFDIAVTPPKPNPMFDEWQTAITKFLTYTKPVKCAYCGRMSKHHWTQLKFFRVAEMESPVLHDGAELFPPLTPVCGKHILAPEKD
jgi:hypothetical protein